MDPRVKELRLIHWKDIITACNTSGMKKKEWMKLNNINSKTFYRNQKLIREYELEKMELPTLSEYRSESRDLQFVDVTAAMRKANSFQQSRIESGMAVRELHPELMIQAGEYHLYIGRDIHEETLTAIFRAIRNV